MDLKAHIASHYMWRRGIMAAGCLLFAAWFAYDGLVAYPAQNAIFRQFQQYKQDHPETWRDDWPKHALEHGLPLEPKEGKPDPTTGQPTEPRTQSDVVFQYVCFGLTLPIGLLFLIDGIRLRGRWIAADDQGLTTSWGRRVPYDRMTRLNLQRWRSKGIAVLYYRDGDTAAEQAVVLDDWKYDRAPITHIVEDVIERLEDDQIEGDSGPLVEPPLPNEQEETDEAESGGVDGDEDSADGQEVREGEDSAADDRR